MKNHRFLGVSFRPVTLLILVLLWLSAISPACAGLDEGTSAYKASDHFGH